MDQLDYEVTEFVIKQLWGIQDHLNKLKADSSNNPILRTYLREAELEEVRQYVAKEMNKSYLDVSTVIDMRFIDKWLSP